MVLELINNNAGIENWVGDISEIGAIYPFVGYEGLMVLLGLIFWIGWHILQIKDEAREWRETIDAHAHKQTPKPGDDQL